MECVNGYKLNTYEHQVLRRQEFCRGCTGAFGLASGGKLSLKPAIDLRRLAARARDARSESCNRSAGGTCEHVLMCICVVATWRSLLDRLRRPRASQVAHRPSSIRALVRSTRPRYMHWASIVTSVSGSSTDVIERATRALPLIKILHCSPGRGIDIWPK